MVVFWILLWYNQKNVFFKGGHPDMDQPNQFRSAFNGFNREDVVRYMEFINNKHSAQVAQLSNELEYLRGKQDTLDLSRVSELEKQLAAALAENDTLKHRIAVLEHSLQEANAAPAAAAPAASELEAYRRAERVERLAKERARQIGRDASTALTDVSGKVEQAADALSTVTEQLAQQLQALQDAVSGGQQAFRNAAAAVESMNAGLEE